MNKNFSRYFWIANIFIWLSIHFVFALIQHHALAFTSNPVDLVTVWWKLLPWFGNWIWMTFIIFKLVDLNERINASGFKRWMLNLIPLVILIPIYWLLSVTMRAFIDDKSITTIPDSLLRVLSNSALLDVFIYLGVLGMAMGIRFYQHAINKQVELNRIGNLLIKEQLKSLRSQLNPHFLFNTLNTIVSLIRLKRESEAIQAITQLSQMLRKILENKDNSNASVKDEIVFINSYLAIQKMRFSNTLNINVMVDESCMDIVIPNMLLHPLVENAIQHGSQLQETVNNFHMSITHNNGMLIVTLTNNVGDSDTIKGFGIGLGNTREILNKLYSNFQLDIKEKYEGVVETILAIPIGGKNA
ncbi:sensor histidine kinase [Alteromonas sp. ASW11-130]|uniref:sensor histidine kinase n=1 Tax=Alteromonas sp. ASW11-130 TaxID=3015775 RepID=UPI0022427B11|nr:histidine kinase [Alteromonas sp. ASW11-130]MCW8090998.1 histidine kinase [Alteromonas sp. ASW11-130]